MIVLLGVAILLLVFAIRWAGRKCPRLTLWLGVFFFGSMLGVEMLPRVPLIVSDLYGWAWLAFVLFSPLYWLVTSIRDEMGAK